MKKLLLFLFLLPVISYAQNYASQANALVPVDKNGIAMPCPSCPGSTSSTAASGVSITAVALGVSITVNNFPAALPTPGAAPVTTGYAAASNQINEISALQTISGTSTTTTYISLPTTTALTVSAAVYLTTSPWANVSICNNSAATMRMQITTSSTVPSNMSTVGLDLAPGTTQSKSTKLGQWDINAHWLWYILPTTVSGTAELNY